MVSTHHAPPVIEETALAEMLLQLDTSSLLVLVTPLRDNISFSFCSFFYRQWVEWPEEGALLLLRDISELQVCDAWRVSSMNVLDAIGLLSRLDRAYRTSFCCSQAKKNTPLLLRETVTIPKAFYSCNIEQLLIISIFSDVALFAPLWSILRRHEAYELLDFLMSQHNELDEVKIKKSSDRYGISASYFRSLCHRYLHTSAKKKMMDWRMASATLQVIESDKSMLDIALGCGYSSASHFSSNFRKMLGVTPTELRNLGKHFNAN